MANLSSSRSDNSLNYSSDINAISVELLENSSELHSVKGLKYLPAWPAINLEFTGLTCEVPELGNARNTKPILHGVSGEFRSHELTAIMGPSGSGKTTLLNLLAGFGSNLTGGEILVNNSPRDMRIFRKMSRYIMQHADALDLQLTIRETMVLAANLKLGNELSTEQKQEVIDEILLMLRLKNAENTKAKMLSGGERKRMSVALELIDNPPVVFLDEATTGLDDLSSSQCVALLRRIAHAGRTIICSIHTPSAKIFEMFDKVYVLAAGRCIYQGKGANIVPYMQHLGISCPLTYNPADFIIEVACHEYGSIVGHMVGAVNNGKVSSWTSEAENGKNTPSKSDTTSGASSYPEVEHFEKEINPNLLKAKSSWWMQYKLLLMRMLLQMWRDKSHIKMKFYMNIILALIVSGLYMDIGNDASKALFNFGFSFTIIIAYLYLPMMPVLLQFPNEINLLKREYYNQWYHLSSYYVAMITAKLPSLFVLSSIYLTIVYLSTNQPLEWFRFVRFFTIAFLTAMTSDSFGLMVSSRLCLVNGMFMGPVMAVPLILLSTYGIGYGSKETYISPFMRFLMSLSYLRHGMEGLVAALYDFGRADTICAETELFCMFKKSQFLLNFLGFNNMNYLWSVSCLIAFYILFTIAAYVMIRQRLKKSTGNPIVVYIIQILMKHFNFTSYNY
ncbi:ATP-binding cassette sub-family G member 4 [Scaptodrosophila lebanonensis]|uniref:ATP-binding cassette sub-family G member 4 n=1 Tax=Drosophila lebanonensis TaxID=7225 RepID=A0A6J2TVD4_DROLE|nr:ATP-binding cassette sub-family G member 4 [Scaptodrosophila lebanonensis]XP_030380512.1 ATP-binding cassette sub-family G member 4 [Scaptodrosophila lebanonensis]XP_030380513.1 ATP-binding cassette sub-family G member 4 [Scaptodrosophila lebanonensis]